MVPGCYRCNNDTTMTTSTWVIGETQYYTHIEMMVTVAEQRRQQHLEAMHRLIYSIKKVFVTPLQSKYRMPASLPRLCRWLK